MKKVLTLVIMFLLVLGISLSFVYAHEGSLDKGKLYSGEKGGSNMVYGMMGYGMGSGMLWLNGFLGFLLLVGLVVLVWLWVFKVWNELTKKGKKAK